MFYRIFKINDLSNATQLPRDAENHHFQTQSCFYLDGLNGDTTFAMFTIQKRHELTKNSDIFETV